MQKRHSKTLLFMLLIAIPLVVSTKPSTGAGVWHVMPIQTGLDTVLVRVTLFTTENYCIGWSACPPTEIAELVVTPCPLNVSCTNDVYHQTITENIFINEVILALHKDTSYYFSGSWSYEVLQSIHGGICNDLVCWVGETLPTISYPCNVPSSHHTWGEIKEYYR